MQILAFLNNPIPTIDAQLFQLVYTLLHSPVKCKAKAIPVCSSCVGRLGCANIRGKHESRLYRVSSRKRRWDSQFPCDMLYAPKNADADYAMLCYAMLSILSILL